MSDNLSPLPNDVRSLLDAERERADLPDAARARLAARIGALGVPPSTGGGGGGGTTLPDAGGLAGAIARHPLAAVGLALVIGGLVGAGAMVVGWDPEPRTVVVTREVEVPSAPAVVSAEPPLAHSPAATAPAIVEEALVATPEAAVRVPGRPASARVDAGADSDRALAAERAVIDTARSALARGENGDALRAVERHAARWERGRLAEERESLRIVALARMGRGAEARAAAARFEASFPGSVFRGAISDAVRAIP